jgi:hypothetical protein
MLTAPAMSAGLSKETSLRRWTSPLEHVLRFSPGEALFVVTVHAIQLGPGEGLSQGICRLRRIISKQHPGQQLPYQVFGRVPRAQSLCRLCYVTTVVPTG